MSPDYPTGGDFCLTYIGLTESLADTLCGHQICATCIAFLGVDQAQPHECRSTLGTMELALGPMECNEACY